MSGADPGGGLGGWNPPQINLVLVIKNGSLWFCKANTGTV